ncbi:P-loop containing nucleoside triphosphate hydrolase protein [Thelonectria olida]|uniref:P-loop containing nucleoside triphosphate hydrolase protein n=1 Tax=Thelonectria olida TaxID=1576542 RepID=A0A9P9AL98_9HYPO|nr:P-loop containing nucleoside triphosphate hydrolase protein [Thelonectria olida]
MFPSLELRQFLHYGCVLANISILSGATLLRVHKSPEDKYTMRPKTRILFTSALIASYLVEAIATLTPTLTPTLTGLQARVVHLVALPIIWSFIGLRKSTKRYTIGAVCIITAVFEVSLLVLSATHHLHDWKWIVRIICQCVRVLALICILASEIRLQIKAINSEDMAEEARPILHGQAVSYGTQHSADNCDAESDDSYSDDDDDDDSDDEDAEVKRLQAKRLKEHGWWGYLKDFSIFLPFLIPRREIKVQIAIVTSLLTVAGTRALNVLMPRQLGIVTDEILAHHTPYRALVIWLLLRLSYGECGLGLIEELAKIPIKQFSYRQITNAAFSHVMNLSMEFHSERDSAEVMKAIEQGEALTNLLETAVLYMAPTLIDLTIALWLLYWKFNIYVTLAMLVAVVVFFTLEVVTSKWNIENRRQKAKTQREEVRVMHQAVQGWQTVSYFNMFAFERRRFGDAVESQLTATQNWGVRDACIQAILEAMVPLTFFTLSSLVLFEISHGRATAGDFVFLIQYWEQLIYPLQYLSHNYRYIMGDLIDAERLLSLLQTKSTVVDEEGAKPLILMKGHVTFENVFFSYDARKPSIQGVDLVANPGETVAFVGPTGAGKSSLLKLLLRFYDVGSGRIAIDDQNIREVTLSSLRDAFGVVPQDPLLFNASIMENLRYARPSATDEDIFEACRAAAIHDKILTFPSGYGTKVGEQGVKLSGGEVQRLAIARVFLKNPPILILDEATSAVDTRTESEIQLALDALKEQRTTFLIAHRLSTVVKADQILVVDEGRIVERGTHSELLRARGKYYDLWTRQAGEGKHSEL